MITGPQLKLLRNAKGMMQKQLAAEMELAQQRISAVEKSGSKISVTFFQRALAALNLTKEEAFEFLRNIPPTCGGGEAMAKKFILFFRTIN